MKLRIGDAVAEATQPEPGASWRAALSCPECGLSPVRVRAYDSGSRVAAWCAGRHPAPIGWLEPDAHVLCMLGVGEPETFRGRIYDATGGSR